VNLLKSSVTTRQYIFFIRLFTNVGPNKSICNKCKGRLIEFSVLDEAINVADEAVNEEMDNSLERAATTATGLDAEQDKGSGPRRQEIMGDTIAQTRSENVSKLSNDLLLARDNTLQSGEDRLKLEELMALCTTLQSRVLAFETIKITQATAIESLKKRVKKLERRNKSRIHGLKRLYRVGSSRRVEFFKDKGLGEENASKQGRIVDIDANEDIYLVNVRTDEDMFGVNDLDGDEVIVESVDVVKTAEETRSVVEEVTAVIIPVSAAITTTTTTAITDVEMTLAQALAELKSAKPKATTITTTPTLTTTTDATTITTVNTRPRVKGIVFHDQEQAPTPTKELLRLDEELAFKLQAKEEEEERLAREKDQQIEEANISWDDVQLEQESSKKQKLEEDKEFEELKQSLEIIPDDGDDVTIDATPLSTKSPTIVDYKIYNEGKKSYFQIIRADDNVWKNQQGLVKVLNWKLYDSCRLHCVTMQNMIFYLLVEKMYPLTNHTLYHMFIDVKLQVDYECEMTFELLRLVKKQLKEGYGRIVGIKSLLEVTAAKLKEFDLLKWDPTRDMDLESAHMVAASKVPMLKPGEFELWRMTIEQYIQMIDYNLWEVIENENTSPKTTVVEGVEKVIPPITAEEKAQKRLEVKARSTLMMGIPNEHHLKFNSIKDAKLLLEAIEKRFGGNASTKKTQRNLLKQQYENFSAPSSETLVQTFDKLQKLVSQLKILGETLSQEHVSQKLLRISYVNSTNVDNVNDAMICAFFSSQPNNPQLVNEDLKQLYPDDLEEMDLR
ncbi:hypothetical protein Tco_0974238, partial [Tanacetum coccineum]